MTSPTYLALLRGINVGGCNKLAMSELRGMFTDAGCDNVQTYIQSGNVLFTAPQKVRATLAAVISAQIAKVAGWQIPVQLRSADELRAVLAANPFLAAGAPEHELYVYFLAASPSAARLQTLDPERSPPDAFAAAGREIYLRCPAGLARTKLTNSYFDTKLATVSTARNWRTVTKLLTLTEG